MDKTLGRFSDRLYALARIVAGFLFVAHGVRKIFGALGGEQVELMSRSGLAGIIELGAGGLIMLGLFTGWAAFIASGQMAVAYFLVHAPQGFWPIVNGGELAVLYCFVFLYFASRGDGPWSLGAALRKSR
jgi:putative oxidoreductase